MKAADEQIAQYGPAGRGAIQVPAGGTLDQYRTFSIELDSERAPGPGVRYGTRPDLPGSPNEPGCALRADVERRPVEDDQLQPAAALVAGHDRHHPQHVGRQRGAREESRDHLSRHGRPVRPRRRRICAAGQPTAAQTWSAAIKLGASTVIPDVKVDTSGAADIVLMGTNAGLFRSTNGGETYGAAPVLTGVVWSLRVPARAGSPHAPSATSDRSCSRRTRERPGRRFQTPATVYSDAGRTTLAVAAPGDAVVYAFAATTGNAAQKDLYRSVDGGLNWTALGLAARPRSTPTAINPT